MMAMRMFLSWGVLGLLLFLIESDSVLIDGMSSSSSSPVAAAAAASAVNPSVIARRHMIAVRPASRNVYGFANQNCSSDLALLEFRSLIIATALTDDAAAAVTTSSKLEFVPVDTGSVLFWVEGVADSTESAGAILARVASQAILMHACYLMMEVCTTTNSSSQRVTSSSKDKDDNGGNSNDKGGNDNDNDNGMYLDTSVAALASAAGCEFSIATTQVVDMRNPNLSRQERLDILEAAGASEDAEDSSIIPRTRSMSITQKDIISTTPTTVLLRRDDGKVHVGWRTAIGPAAGTGAPGKAPRRNYKGVLGTFALKNRLDLATTTTTTAMEPEIAFLMASLGNIQANSRVLDPCCGSASLLLCAAARGATVLVGVDQNAAAFTGATSEFARHGLPVPELVQGDVLAPQSTPALDTPPQLYDAILCDPPYNIGAPVLVHGQDARPASYHRDRDRGRGDDTTGDHQGNDLTTNRDGPNNAEIPKVVDLTAAILGIAQTTLKVGGRLVFFLPVRGNDAKRPLVEVLRMHGYHVPKYNDDAQISNRLRLSHGRLQRFSPTFSRWLVTMEVI